MQHLIVCALCSDRFRRLNGSTASPAPLGSHFSLQLVHQHTELFVQAGLVVLVHTERKRQLLLTKELRDNLLSRVFTGAAS